MDAAAAAAETPSTAATTAPPSAGARELDTAVEIEAETQEGVRDAKPAPKKEASHARMPWAQAAKAIGLPSDKFNPFGCCAMPRRK